MMDAFKKLFVAEDWMPARRVLQRDVEWWNKLREDCAIRFGTMTQGELSGKTLTIHGHHRYRFGDGQFLSHHLSDGRKTLCQMIVATVGPAQVYLAISRKLEAKEIDHLFSDDEWKKLPDLSDVSRLYVREQTPGLRDWLTMQYRRQIVGLSGEKTAPDGTVIRFLYSLFVSEANDKALEIEKYDDGSYDVYVTIYRPVSDIVQLSVERKLAAPPAPAMQAEKARADARLPEARRDPAIRAPKSPAEPVAETAVLTAPAQAAMAAQPAASAEVYELPSARRENAPVATAAPEPASPASPEPQAVPLIGDASLACNIHVASKIIDEAIRNDMQLSDVVRRILGLPVAMDEQVHFQIPLTTRDYQMLSERYNVPFEEQARIRSLIVEDLIDFTGERDKQAGKILQKA